MAIFSSLLGGNTLYYPGCMIKAVLPKVEENYRHILKKMKVDFIELPDKELCCASPVINAGFATDARNVMKQNLELFRAHGINRIITPCPACAYTFKEEYKNKLGKEWTIQTEHITETFETAISKGKLKLNKVFGKVTFHDPCYLARYQRIIAPPRKILSKVAAEVVEMRLNGLETFCCGAGGGVKANFDDQANVSGQARIEMAVETGAEILTTACPMCYQHLKDAAKDQIKVLEFSEVIIKAMNES
jgi:heterodisulfide reductase subunit D